jgi:poly(hydroxyalkanoate) granule-associated protein
MAKKLKKLVVDNQLATTIRDSAQQIWLAGLGAYGKAQEEGNKVFDALVREGEAIQAKTRKVAEDKVSEMAAKATGTWDKLEQVFENRVSKALNSLGVPTKSDIEDLAARVAVLTTEVEKLNGGTPIVVEKAVKAVKAAPKRVRKAAEAVAEAVTEAVEAAEEAVVAPVQAAVAKKPARRSTKAAKPAAAEEAAA